MSNKEPVLMHTTTIQYTGLKNAAVKQTSIRPIVHPQAVPVDNNVLEDMTSFLLATAEVSGQNLTIENHSIPELGMGGYYPAVQIRPNYQTVRAILDKKELPVRQLATPPTINRLKSGAAAWPDASPEMLDALQQDPSHLPHHVLVKLVRELDRRFMQLWDKVGFEREKGLVDYTPIIEQHKE